MREDAAPGEAPRRSRLPQDLLIGVALLTLCAVAYWVTLGFREAPAALAQNVQPATFPRGVILVIAALAAGMILLGLPLREKARRMPPPTVFLTGAMMLGFVLAMQHLGIIAAMALFALIMPILWGERRPLPLVLFALLFPAAIWLVFVELLDVHFEPGIVRQLIG